LSGGDRDHAPKAVTDGHARSLVEQLDQIVDVARDGRCAQPRALGITATVVAHGVQIAEVADTPSERGVAVHRPVNEHNERRVRNDVLADEEIGD
jgi:hypothetical protein